MLGRTYLYPFMRFATPDVARDGWNLYGYTGGNPVNYVDPDGEFTILVAVNMDTGSLDDPFSQPSLPSFKTVASFVLSLIPGIGDAKDVQEALTGVDLVAGEADPRWQDGAGGGAGGGTEW
jgi:hypothetical protein